MGDRDFDFSGKKVLGVGPGIDVELRGALSGGAELVEAISVAGESDPGFALASWEGRREAPGTVALRSVTGESLEDRDEWDVILAKGIEPTALLPLLDRIHRALKPEGVLITPKHLVNGELGGVQLEAPAPVAPTQPEPSREPGNVMLHVHNVRRCGGTGNFVYDMVRCFPEWYHVALCVNDAVGDRQWILDTSEVMKGMYAPALTKGLLEEINPRVLVLHATAGKKLEGEWPYNWLQDGGRRFVIAVHHVPTYPLLPADLDVFVSDHVKNRYKQFLERMKDHRVIPPCTDLEPYLSIPRSPSSYATLDRATTGGKHTAELKAHAAAGEFPGWSFSFNPPGRLGAMPGYLKDFPVAVVWSGLQETWCRTVTEALAAGCLTVAHRAGAIPEQIRTGENGFLFDNGEELVKVLATIRSMSPEARAEIARAGREWAQAHAGFKTMKEAYYPFLVQAALRRS